MSASQSRLASGRLLAFVALAATGLPAAAQTVVTYPLPSGGHPQTIVPGPGGMWFTENENRLGRIGPDGNVTEFPVALRPVGLVAAPDGNLWFTSVGTTSGGFLSRMTPEGVVTDIAAVDQGGAITVGPDRRLWFIESAGFDAVTLDGTITKYAFLNDGLTDIVTGPDGNLWFTQFGELEAALVGRITPDGVITTYFLNLHAWDLAAGPDGSLWVVAPPGLVHVAPDGTTTYPAAPTSAGFGIAAGSDGNIWFGDGNRIGRMTTAGTSQSISLPAPSSIVTSIAAGPDGRMWFAEPEAGRVGSVTLTDPSDANRLDLAGGRFEVRATRFQGLASGAGHPVSLTTGSGYFWFFDAGNPELMVKVLDGCAVNGHRWFFGAGLTNLAVMVQVTDTVSGETKTYSNPPGRAFSPIQDIGALASCP